MLWWVPAVFPYILHQMLHFVSSQKLSSTTEVWSYSSGRQHSVYFIWATCLQSIMLNHEFGHQGVRQLVLLHALFSPDHQAFDRSLLACGIPRGEWCRPCWPWLSAGSRRWSQHAKALEDLFANLFNWYLWSICYLANLEQMRTKACGRLILATLMDFSQLGKKRHKTASN